MKKNSQGSWRETRKVQFPRSLGCRVGGNAGRRVRYEWVGSEEFFYYIYLEYESHHLFRGLVTT